MRVQTDLGHLTGSLGSSCVDHLPFACLRFYALQNHGLDIFHNPERLRLSGCRRWVLHPEEGIKSEMSAFSRDRLQLRFRPQPGLDKLTKGHPRYKMPVFLQRSPSVCLEEALPPQAT